VDNPANLTSIEQEADVATLLLNFYSYAVLQRFGNSVATLLREMFDKLERGSSFNKNNDMAVSIIT
jgi:hypothetical protein